MELDEARKILIEYFEKDPGCLEFDKRICAVVMDLMPELKAERNVLLALCRAGYVGELKQVDDPVIIRQKYQLILTKELGYAEDVSTWCVDTWMIVVSKVSGNEKRIKEEYNVDDLSEIGTDLVVVKSEYERLLAQIGELRAIITSLTAERDELAYHECRELAAEYDKKIGQLELLVLSAKLKVLKLKRIIEIIQSQINRQERKSEKKAEEQVEKEYKHFEEEFNKKAEEAKKANQYKEDEDKREEEWRREQEETASEKRKKYKSRTEEMKALYRKIVKALHPDMNPDETEAEKQMFKDAVDAYDNGDLRKLRELTALIEQGKISETPYNLSEDEIEKLKEIIEGLKQHIESLREQIDEIKNSFPYNMKDFLHDEEAVTKRQGILNKLLEQYDELAEELKERLAKMIMGGNANGEKED